MANVNPTSSHHRHSELKGVADVTWFAGLAMQAMIAKQGIPESPSAREEIALWAFRMAQTMVVTDNQLHASGAD